VVNQRQEKTVHLPISHIIGYFVSAPMGEEELYFGIENSIAENQQIPV
jgi:hypothetical protein